MSKEQAFELSKSIGNRGKTLNRDLQKVACTAIGYANIHGDITVAQNIWENLSDNKGIRLNSFVKYLETYGQIKFDKEAKTFVYSKRDDVIKDVMELFLTLSDNPWYQAIKQEPVGQEYDINEMVKKFVAKCESLAKNELNTVKNLEMLAKVKSVAGIVDTIKE